MDGYSGNGTGGTGYSDGYYMDGGGSTASSSSGGLSSCQDQPDFQDSVGAPCSDYEAQPSWCAGAETYANADGVHAGDACCACGGGGSSSSSSSGGFGVGDGGYADGYYMDGYSGDGGSNSSGSQLAGSCVDFEGWSDEYGEDCQFFFDIGYCAEGALGPAWNEDWGSIGDYPEYADASGVHPGIACCACGGGNYSASYVDPGASAVVTCSGECACSPSAGATSGEISDGSLGQAYINNANCQWLVAADAEISLTFTYFVTEANFDFVRVYKCYSTSCSTRELIVELSGSAARGTLASSTGVASLDAAYTSSTGYLLVEFVSDSSVQEEGFGAEWTLRPLPVGVFTTTTTPPPSPLSTTPIPSSPEYYDLSDTCRHCARDAFVYSPGLAITRGCRNCGCGDGSRMCGCVWCPEIIPESDFFPPGVTMPTTPPPSPLSTTPIPSSPAVVPDQTPGSSSSGSEGGSGVGFESLESGSGSLSEVFGSGSGSEVLLASGSGSGGGSGSGDLPASITGLVKSGYGHCSLAQGWDEIVHATDFRHRYRTGGLGTRLVPGQWHVWLCDRYDPCLGGKAAEDDMMCYAFNEEYRFFLPLGPNSQVKFIKPKKD